MLESPKSSDRPRSLLLDVLRIGAASWVMVFHWTRQSWFSWAPDWLEGFARAGYLGVDVFFMLSGAVIAYTALGRTWRGFAAARFLRLFPAYLGSTVVVGALLIARGSLDPTPAGWLAFTGLHFFVREPSFIGVAWTLLYEVEFYFLIGLLILLMRDKLTEDGIRNGTTVFLLFALFASFSGNRELSLLTISGFGGMFALGAMLGISRTRQQLQRNLPQIVVAASLTYFKLTDRTAGMGLSEASTVAWSLGLTVFVGAIILWSAMRPSKVQGLRFRNGIMTLALMTYPLYLLHQDLGLNVIQLLRATGLSIPLAGLASAVIVVLLSWLSVRWFEPWSRKRLRRLFGWLPPRRAAEASPLDPSPPRSA